MEHKNVLYISYDGMTDPLGQSQVIPYLIGLSKKGISFTILSCEKRENYNTNQDLIKNILHDAGIIWNPIFYTKNPPILSTVLDCYNLKRQARSLNNRYKFDIVHCRSYISSLIGLWMTKTFNIPFVFDMRGFWADERIDGGLWDINNWLFKQIYKFFKKKEIEFLNKSAAVISLTQKGKEEILTWSGINFNADKITVIPCCVDMDVFNPQFINNEDKTAAKESLKLGNSNLIIGYLGSIGTWYLLDDMMRFFADVKKRIQNAKFFFVTQDSAADINLAAKKYNVDLNDIIITKANRKDVPLMVSLFNYGLFFIKPSYSKTASSPTKQGEIMAMGIPIICNWGVGDTDQIVTKYQSGIIVMNGKNEDAINKIDINTTADLDLREKAMIYFSLTNGVEKYYQVYNSIL